MDNKVCHYCSLEIKEKSYKAEGEVYHLKCVRKLRKKLELLKQKGKLKPGQESEININSKIQ